MEMLRALGGVALTNGKTCKCPFHDDQHPSASVRLVDGAWKFHCFTCNWGGDVFDVLAKKRGCSVADVLRETNGPKPESKPVTYPSLEALVQTYPNVEAVYKYTHPETKAVEFAAVRYYPVKEGKKQFGQCSPATGGGWVKAKLPKVMPLYNRTRMLTSERVVVVEGEKTVHALAEIGIVATTSPGGAGRAGEADWSPLQGKTVYLWPDNDTPDPVSGRVSGELHMRDVQKILETMDVRLFWIDQTQLGLAAKGDAVDFIRANQGDENDKRIAVELVLEEAQPLGAAQELKARLRSITSGEWQNIEWTWPTLTQLAQALVPDTVNALCGEPGAAKSLMLLESWWKWNLAGHRTAIFELEDDRVYHLQRVLAQLEQNALLTDTEWMRRNPDRVMESYANQKDIIGSLGRLMWDAPDRQVATSDLADWFEARCAEGFEICIIDPVTAASASDKPWLDDQRFIFKVKTTAKRYHARLVYAIHPRLSHGKTGASLGRMAGGAAYPRFSHSVFWLTKHENYKTADVWRFEGGKRPVSFNRTLKISKARNGRGAGTELAFHLNEGSLCFEEYGSISRESEGTREAV